MPKKILCRLEEIDDSMKALLTEYVRCSALLKSIHSKITILINYFGYSVNSWLNHQQAFPLMVATVSIIIFYVGWIVDVSRFSPDSWSYYELSKTVFSDNFYKFNTVRSYFSNEYSTSFPFGFPVVLAFAQAVLGEYPMTAVIVNVCASLMTALVFYKICNQIRLERLMWIAVISSLLLYPGYLDEVFSGRSIPFAMMLFSGAIYANNAQRHVLTGVLLGASVLVRFDYLVFAILFQGAVFVLKSHQLKDQLKLLGGFILGLVPWIVYSLLHFGGFWVSDNSWVTISALPAFVLDYPAAPVISAYENPELWLSRVFSNIPVLLEVMVKSSFRFPLLVIFLSVLLLKKSFWRTVGRKRLTLAVFLLAASIAPYLLTGYFDSRYFALIFFLLSFAIIRIVYEIDGFSVFGLNLFGLTFIVLILTFSFGGVRLARIWWSGVQGEQRMLIQDQEISSLIRYHNQSPESTLIFEGTLGISMAAKYGALTGMKTALPPSNLKRMNESERERYFSSMVPYLLESNLSGVDE